MRRTPVSEHELKLDKIGTFANSRYLGVVFEWSGNIGWGQYTIYREHYSDEWIAESEGMDEGEDKDFLRELLKQFADKIKVVD